MFGSIVLYFNIIELLNFVKRGAIFIFMKQFVHPSRDDITLAGVLAALADPMRIEILRRLMKESGCHSCSEAAPCPDMAKSTLSNHFRILREAGLVRTVKQGVENRNTVRLAEINDLFPGLLKTVMKLAEKDAA